MPESTNVSISISLVARLYLGFITSISPHLMLSNTLHSSPKFTCLSSHSVSIKLRFSADSK
ncbi:MAG: hypothetical protein KKE71_01730, partial [Nanoarchaeota archaeon]|nr:hypothetical protein [Nanoarchaeota archaeon]